jgi:hypothetical protein
VTAPDLTSEDTTAMRRQGDWREYLRSEMDRGSARRLAPAAKSTAPAPPGHRPGAWPAGTRPPDPPPPADPAETTRAIAEYRHWLRAGRPRITTHCECPACQQLTGGTR